MRECILRHGVGLCSGSVCFPRNINSPVSLFVGLYDTFSFARQVDFIVLKGIVSDGYAFLLLLIWDRKWEKR